jgi:predicted nucleic acid-binding protein
MPTVYIETSIVSYLTARPSRDVVTLARQELTREWWDNRRARHDLFTSDVVVGEASEGDDEAARQRLDVLQGIEELETTSEAEDLASAFLEKGPLPEKAAVDALHIGIAATEGIDYLLTWNCTHIANAAMRKPIEEVCRTNGVEAPIMCTPEELMEE